MGITSAIFSEEPFLQSSSLRLLGRHVFFFLLDQVEEGKGEGQGKGGGGRALVMWESNWCDTLVVVMNLLRYMIH